MTLAVPLAAPRSPQAASGDSLDLFTRQFRDVRLNDSGIGLDTLDTDSPFLEPNVNAKPVFIKPSSSPETYLRAVQKNVLAEYAAFLKKTTPKLLVRESIPSLHVNTVTWVQTSICAPSLSADHSRTV